MSETIIPQVDYLEHHFKKNTNLPDKSRFITRDKQQALDSWKRDQQELAQEVARKINVSQLLEKIKTINENRAAEIGIDGLIALGKLILSLNNQLTTFDTIISDETSARLPTNILRQIILHKRQKEGLNPGIRTHYLTSGRNLPQGYREKLKNFFDKERHRVQKGRDRNPYEKDFGHVLVVTEAVRSIQSMETFIKSLRENNITDLSIAIITAKDMARTLGILVNQANIFIADTGEGSLELLGERMFYRKGTGVTKVKPSPGAIGSTEVAYFPHPARNPKTGNLGLDHLDRQQVIEEREIASVIAEGMLPLIE